MQAPLPIYKGYETIDLTDLAYLPWVTGLSVDMTRLSDPDAKDGSALGKLFKDGDLSTTHLEDLGVYGDGGRSRFQVRRSRSTEARS